MNPDDEAKWYQLLAGIMCVAIVLSALWLSPQRAEADEPYVSHHEIMLACFDMAVEQAKYIEFSSAEEESYAVGMMAAGCMYMQLVEQCGLWVDDSFAYPIEPDDEPGEFEHDVQ